MNIKSVIMIAILDKKSEDVLNSKKNENSKTFLFNPIKFTHNALANPSIEIYLTIFLFFEKPKNIAKMAVIKTTISVCINYFLMGKYKSFNFILYYILSKTIKLLIFSLKNIFFEKK